MLGQHVHGVLLAVLCGRSRLPQVHEAHHAWPRSVSRSWGPSSPVPGAIHECPQRDQRETYPWLSPPRTAGSGRLRRSVEMLRPPAGSSRPSSSRWTPERFFGGSIDGRRGRMAGHRAASRPFAIPFYSPWSASSASAALLMIVTELADANLEQVLEQRHREGHTGIPRAELLVYLLEAAEVLDLMKAQFGLQHLDVKPLQNLFLLSNHVKVADFGLVHSLSHSHHDEITPLSASMLTPLYASPELCQGRISPHCDQYSLALVYHELLTGILPFNGKNARQLLMQHTCGVPDLHRLSSGDAVVVGRALAKDPAERFGSGLEFHSGPAPGKSLEPPGDFSSALCPAPLTRPDRTNGSPPRRGGQPAGAGGGELLPGYQFLQCLERGPLTEVWQVTDPSGRPRQLSSSRFRSASGTEPTGNHRPLEGFSSSRPGVDGSGGLWPGPVGPDHRSTLQDSAGSLARMSGGGTSRDPLGGAVSSPGRDGRGPGHLVPGDRSVPPCPDSTATGARWARRLWPISAWCRFFGSPPDVPWPRSTRVTLPRSCSPGTSIAAPISTAWL